MSLLNASLCGWRESRSARLRDILCWHSPVSVDPMLCVNNVLRLSPARWIESFRLHSPASALSSSISWRCCGTTLRLIRTCQDGFMRAGQLVFSSTRRSMPWMVHKREQHPESWRLRTACWLAIQGGEYIKVVLWESSLTMVTPPRMMAMGHYLLRYHRGWCV